MGLIKNIGIFLAVIAVVIGFRMFHVKKEKSAGEQPKGGFVEIPRPRGAPMGKVLLIGPQNCPREEGQRIDRLERLMHAAGIPCVRLNTANIPPADQAEANRIEKIMTGEIPIVFVGSFAKNNPTLEEVKAQFLAIQAR